MNEKVQNAAGASTGFQMRESRVLRRIKEGKVARVLKLNTSDAKVAEIFAQSQPDAIWMCMEHVSTTFTEADHIVRAAKISDVDTVLRVSRGGYSDYVRGLEIDATGLIIPHVMGLDDARKVRDMSKFAPVGRRAWDGGNADGMYARIASPEYLAASNKQRFVLHQIEDPEAVDDLDAMAELDGVDGLFYGPGDFSLALGVPGEMNHPEVERVRKLVAETARKHGKIAATVCGQAEVGRYADLGYNFLNVGADVVALSQYADKAVAAFGDL